MGRVREALGRAIRLTVFLNTPIMIGVALLSADVLTTLFGSKWVGAAPSLTGLALAGALWPVALLNLTYTKAMGHTRAYLNLELKRKGLIIVSVLAAAPFGLTAIALSQLFVNGLCVVLFTRYVEQTLDYGLASQLRQNAKTIAGSICMGISLALVLIGAPTVSMERLFLG
jgi:O-antigen/teichoic acid export membrane protein